MPGFPSNRDSAASATGKSEKKGLFARLRDGLTRTRTSLTEGVTSLVLGSRRIDSRRSNPACWSPTWGLKQPV